MLVIFRISEIIVIILVIVLLALLKALLHEKYMFTTRYIKLRNTFLGIAITISLFLGIMIFCLCGIIK